MKGKEEMAVNRNQLVEVRKSLHQDIYDTVNETEHTAIRVLREPNNSKKTAVLQNNSSR